MTDKPVRQIFFDTETTGIGSGHRILELGAVESIDRELTGNNFHRLINPQREIDEDAINIHGITHEMVHDKPLFSAVVEEFLAYIEDAEVIIHNASFDVKMVNNELNILSKEHDKNYGQFSHYCQISDSLELARKVVKSGKRNLDALCDYFHIDRSERTTHSAVLDCELLFRVYIALTSGQKELFVEEAKVANSAESEKPLADYRGLELPMAIVSAAEKELHQAFIKKHFSPK